MTIEKLNKEELIELSNKYEEYLKNFNYLDDIRMTLEEFYRKQKLGNYLITNYDEKYITNEELEIIKDKIDCIAQHFGEHVENIEIDLSNQLDEFFLLDNPTKKPNEDCNSYLYIEVVTKEVAISNEQDCLDCMTVEDLNELGTSNANDLITENTIGCYHVMVGGKYYFRQM